jgi:putative protease
MVKLRKISFREADMEEIGRVEKYFGKIGVAAIKITAGELKVGDRIKIKGHSTDFDQAIDSMQVEHASVQKVSVGDDVGIKVKEKVHENDKVYIVRE